ncbi:hypothetical protein P7K49_005808 [Saguinus oedipus]|uniref:Uncharacterized protein n=1 Tax=Saguinus oedipus TaxID=9490 RepID=A0ABQ9W0L2_SAGOE|nr:hypothetical protein P7K49_005808 [Saguinus oedipus]
MTLCVQEEAESSWDMGTPKKQGWERRRLFPIPLPATRGPFSAEKVGLASPRSGTARNPRVLSRLQHEPPSPGHPTAPGGPRGCGALVLHAVIRDALSLFFELRARAPVVGGLNTDIASPALGPQLPTGASAQSPGRPQGNFAVQRRFWNWTKHRTDREATPTLPPTNVHSLEATPTLPPMCAFIGGHAHTSTTVCIHRRPRPRFRGFWFLRSVAE